MTQHIDPVALRDRAYALADSGRFRDWEQLYIVLEREGGDAARALDDDGMFKLMIRNRMKRSAQARSGQRSR